MNVINAAGLVAPAPDSQYRLISCSCNSSKPVYVRYCDGQWRVKCLGCGTITEGFDVQHDAQLKWNKEVAQREKT